MRWEFDAGGQSVAPNQPAQAPCFAAGGEQQDEAFRQLALALKHDTRAGLRNIGDRAAARRRSGVEQNAGIVMELPARLSAQFGSGAGITDSDPQKLRLPRKSPAAQPATLGILH
jgi:hypothetical protein